MRMVDWKAIMLPAPSGSRGSSSCSLVLWLRFSAGGVAGCESAQHQLSDALGEPFIDRAAGDQQPVEERPAEHIEGELEVEIRAQVTALDAAPQHLGQRGPPSGQEPVAEGACQFWPLGH